MLKWRGNLYCTSGNIQVTHITETTKFYSLEIQHHCLHEGTAPFLYTWHGVWLFFRCFLLLHIYSNCRHFFFKARRNFSVALKLLVLRHNRQHSWETEAEAGLSWCNNMGSTESRRFQTENQSSEPILGNKEVKWTALGWKQKTFFQRKEWQGLSDTVTCLIKKVNRVFHSHPLSKSYICFIHRTVFLLLWALGSCLPTFLHIYFCKTKYEQQLNDKTPWVSSDTEAWSL